MIFIRKSLDYVFTREELHVLDSVIPPFRRSKQVPQVEVSIDDILHLLQKSKCFDLVVFFCSLKSAVSRSHINGKGQSYSAIPKNSSKVNISDEVARSGAWLHVNQSKASFQE